MRKVCIYCNKSKNPKSFAKHSHSKDNLDSRCKRCIRNQTKLREKLRENSPSKPNVCECCGKVPDKWCLDHDHKNNSFRGWLCSSCNTAIGQLGDDLKGVINAVNYLLNRA